jgi:protein unc-119
MATVTPEDVCKFERPTEKFLCALSDNVYGLDFLKFTISDYDTKKVIFQVGKDSPPPADVSIDFSSIGEDMYRKIRYRFSEDVLRLPFIQTSLVFSVGQVEVRKFRMIERHYFRNKLVRSFDFQFGFCIPGSENTWDAVYAVPNLKDDMINDMIDHPYQTMSDSFYFVNDQLIMHNKAAYEYIREDAAQAKKSYEDKFGYLGSKAAKKETPAAKPTAGAPGAKKVAEGKATAGYLEMEIEGAEERLDAMEIADAKEEVPPRERSSSSLSPREREEGTRSRSGSAAAKAVGGGAAGGGQGAKAGGSKASDYF